jgi:hypothetical protein
MSRTGKLSLVWSLVLLFALGTAPAPAAAQTSDPAATGVDLNDDDDGFDDWGLLGLLGLLGLMGRKRDHRDVVEPRRV